jgi:hypothetical protein
MLVGWHQDVDAPTGGWTARRHSAHRCRSVPVSGERVRPKADPFGTNAGCWQHRGASPAGCLR